MVIEVIHKNDTMFVDNKEHYFSCGKEMSVFAEKVASKIDGLSNDEIKILELPGGFGRVTRYLVEKFKSANITAVDIYDEATEFQKKILKTNGVTINVGDYLYDDIPDDYYDVAIMGSLITHFNEEASEKILSSFMKKIKKSGYGIVSTTGKKAYQMLKENNIYQITENDRKHLLESVENEKFAFCEYDLGHDYEKLTTDVVGNAYGMSLIPDSWMRVYCSSHGFLVDEYAKGGWDNHQDVYILKHGN